MDREHAKVRRKARRYKHGGHRKITHAQLIESQHRHVLLDNKIAHCPLDVSQSRVKRTTLCGDRAAASVQISIDDAWTQRGVSHTKGSSKHPPPRVTDLGRTLGMQNCGILVRDRRVNEIVQGRVTRKRGKGRGWFPATDLGRVL